MEKSGFYFLVNIETLSGELINFKIDALLTVSKFKEILSSKTQIPIQ
jgi:hypothetical protein